MSDELKDQSEYHLPGDFLAALKTRPVSEIKGVFKNLIYHRSMRMGSANGAEELLQLQAGIKTLQELENFLLNEMQRK